jgi:NADH:ubiquinone oxidoreductase subunit 3 (subunit A)
MAKNDRRTASAARLTLSQTVPQPDTLRVKDFVEPMVSNTYLALVILFLAALAFGLGPLALARLWARFFSPQKRNSIKNSTYECGLVSEGDAWVQFRSAYYLYAIIFLIFDVEAVFLLPFAVAFTGLTAAACAAMLVFVLLLVEGLAWAWAKGILTWA